MIRYHLIRSEAQLLSESQVLPGNPPKLITTFIEQFRKISDSKAELDIRFGIAAAQDNNPIASLHLKYDVFLGNGKANIIELECLIWHALSHIEDWYLYDDVCTMTGGSPLPQEDSYALASRLYLNAIAVLQANAE